MIKYSVGILISLGVLCSPVLSQTESKFGYENLTLVSGGNGFDLYEGRVSGEEKPHILVVHKATFGDRIMVAVKGTSSPYVYSPKFLSELTRIEYIRSRFRVKRTMQDQKLFKNGSPIQLKHYASGFERNDLSSDSPQEPLFWGSVENQPKVRLTHATSKTLELTGRIYADETVFDVSQRCIAIYSKEGHAHGRALSACGGGSPLGHPLAYLGMLTSQKLYEESSFALYRAQRNANERTYFIIVHTTADDEPLLQIETLGKGKYRVAKSFEDKLFGIKAFSENVVGTRVGIGHIVKGAENPKDPSRPNFWTEIRIFHGGPIKRQFVEFTDLTLPRNTKREWIERNRELVAADVRRKNDAARNLSDKEKEAALAEARKTTAQRYGYVWKPDDYWEPFRDYYFSKAGRTLHRVTVQYYFDGEFDAGSKADGALFVWPMFRYIENLTDKCPHKIGADYVLGEIVTTSTTVDGAGNAVSPTREVGRRKVKIPRRFSKAYFKHFDRFEKYQKKIGTSYTVDSIISMYTGRGNAKRRAANMAEPMWGVNWVFKNEACDSPIIEQLGENLARAADGRRSIQSAQVSFNGAPLGGDRDQGAVPAKLLFHGFDKNRLPTYNYASQGFSWSPGAISEIVRRGEVDYGKTYENHLGSVFPLPINIVVENAPHKSLRSVRVRPIGTARTWGSMFADFQFDDVGSSQWLSIRSIMQDASKVRYFECEYRDGGTLAYWYDPVPGVLSESALRAADPNHPYLKIGPRREACPESVAGK